MWEGRCDDSTCPDCSVSGQEQVTDAPLSGASPLPPIGDVSIRCHLGYAGVIELGGAKREGALGVAQLIGLAKLLADRVLEDSEHLMA